MNYNMINISRYVKLKSDKYSTIVNLLGNKLKIEVDEINDSVKYYICDEIFKNKKILIVETSINVPKKRVFEHKELYKISQMYDICFV
jgi:hypothetical protein